MRESGITPSQTVGPFFAFALTPAEWGFAALAGNNLLAEGVTGERVSIEGRVFDGNDQPIPDALVEIWQADAAGRYPGSGTAPLPNTRFTGFGRCATDPEGRYSFTTVKPGPVAGPDGRMQAPHIDVGVFARGLLNRLFTRIYFADEPANETDPILALVPPERRATLTARRGAAGAAQSAYVFDIRLQGASETVFFQA
jgi:protocatechuate 3,4-dioxygenase alpha subunit